MVKMMDTGNYQLVMQIFKVLIDLKFTNIAHILFARILSEHHPYYNITALKSMFAIEFYDKIALQYAMTITPCFPSSLIMSQVMNEQFFRRLFFDGLFPIMVGKQRSFKLVGDLNGWSGQFIGHDDNSFGCIDRLLKYATDLFNVVFERKMFGVVNDIIEAARTYVYTEESNSTVYIFLKKIGPTVFKKYSPYGFGTVTRDLLGFSNINSLHSMYHNDALRCITPTMIYDKTFMENKHISWSAQSSAGQLNIVNSIKMITNYHDFMFYVSCILRDHSEFTRKFYDDYNMFLPKNIITWIQSYKTFDEFHADAFLPTASSWPKFNHHTSSPISLNIE
jgi:hypothetical protein